MNYYKNNAFSVLASAATSGGTTLTLATGTGSRFPAADFLVTLIGYDGSGNENAWEIVRCTARAGDILTVVRAQEGTTAIAWPDAARIENRVTAAAMEELQNKHWADITGKPAVIAAGADAAAARAAIDALGEAPSDGKTYGRKDAAWVEAGGTPVIRTPTNTAPAAAATGVLDGATLSASAYYSLYSIPMAASQWQVSVGIDFATTVVSTGDVAGTGTTYALAGGLLSVSAVYYWRVRYKDTEGMYSDWSSPTSFTTAASFNDYIATPTATPSAFGDPMEGGFYAGLIWNELVQTATSSAIGTGTKVFAVPSMTGAPIVYAGQQLEVRSRANPANKMAGTVTGAVGTALTLSITSVGGSGTFTDWSIMSRYRVIVAPKASGENAAIAWKNANDAGPVATGTLSEGRKATLAMVAAGTSTVYPAAHWCNNLSIAGKTDWYLPARDELELCWRNLKPTADANYVAADRPVGATPNYMNLGSYGDTANTHGLDSNSSPVGAAHISGTPARVAAGKNFRTSESEAFAYGSFFYWSASEYSATFAWTQYWDSSYPGCQDSLTKSSAAYVRAVRRSII